MAKKIREFVVSKTAPETSNVVWVEPKNKGYEAKILGSKGWTPITGLSEEESENLPSCISLGSMMIPDDESKASYNGNIIKDFILNKKPFDLEGKTFYVDLGGYVNVNYPMNIMNGKLLFKGNINQGFTVQNGWSLNMLNVYVEWLSENGNNKFRLFTNPSVDFYIPQIIIDHCSFINLVRTIDLTGIYFNPQEIKLGIGKVYFNDSVWKNNKHYTQNTLSNFIVYDLFTLTNNYAENYIVWVNAGYTNEYNFYKSDYALDLMAEVIVENNVFDGGVYNTGTSVTSYHASVLLEVDVVYFRKNHVKRCISIKEDNLIDGEINGSHTFVLYCNKVYCDDNIIENIASLAPNSDDILGNSFFFKAKGGVYTTDTHRAERYYRNNILQPSYEYLNSLGYTCTNLFIMHDTSTMDICYMSNNRFLFEKFNLCFWKINALNYYILNNYIKSSRSNPNPMFRLIPESMSSVVNIYIKNNILDGGSSRTFLIGSNSSYDNIEITDNIVSGTVLSFSENNEIKTNYLNIKSNKLDNNYNKILDSSHFSPYIISSKDINKYYFNEIIYPITSGEIFNGYITYPTYVSKYQTFKIINTFKSNVYFPSGSNKYINSLNLILDLNKEYIFYYSILYQYLGKEHKEFIYIKIKNENNNITKLYSNDFSTWINLEDINTSIFSINMVFKGIYNLNDSTIRFGVGNKEIYLEEIIDLNTDFITETKVLDVIDIIPEENT